MASSGGKSLAVGHISGFQIDPKISILTNESQYENADIFPIF